MENEGIRQKSARAAKWSSITEIVVKIIQPISNMILARILVPEAFAAVALINMVISFADLFTDVGFQKYLIQRDFESEEKKTNITNVAFWTNLLISIVLWLLILCFKDYVAIIIGNVKLGNGIVVAALALPMTSFSSIQMALFKRRFDFQTLFYSRTIGALVPFVITIPFALAGMGYWSIIIGTLCGKLFDALYLTFKSEWRPKLFYSKTLLKEMFSFSSWTLIESITVWLTVWIGVFIVGRILDDYYTGLYTTAINTVNSIMSIVVSASTSVLFATLSRLQNDRKEYEIVFLKFQRTVGMLVLPMGVGILVYQKAITYILLGSKWLEASCLLGIWAFSYSFSIVFGNLFSEVYRSNGRPKLSVLAQILHIVVLAPVCYFSAKSGFVTLAYARSLCRFEFVLVHLFIMYFSFGFSPLKMISNVFPYIIASVVMGLFGYVFCTTIPNIIIQFFTIPICAIIYALVLFIPKNSRNEIKGLLLGLFSQRNKT